MSSKPSNIISIIDSATTLREIFHGIIEHAVALPNVTSAALYVCMLPRPGELPELELVASAGEKLLQPPSSPFSSGSFRVTVSQDEQDSNKSTQTTYSYVRISLLGEPLGWLCVSTLESSGVETNVALQELAHLAAGALEHHRTSAQLRKYAGKLEILNELNRLVAAGVGLERVMRTISREAAFRFSADIVMSLLFTNDTQRLEIMGCYGCPPQKLPKHISISNSQLGRNLRLGGITAIPELRLLQDSGLEFLIPYGISSIQCTSIATHGKNLGAIIIGFKKQTNFGDYENVLLEEYAHGAAIAIVNAINQEKLASYAEKLEELVEAKTADLAIQTARADEANKAKSEFVANISHELRTPLTAIVGYSSIIADGLFGPVTGQQHEALFSIRKAAEHLRELINNILDMAKIEAGKTDAKPAEVELWPLLEQIHKLMLQTAHSKGLSVSLPDPKTLNLNAVSKIWIDSRHIRQILINLLSNAIKYTPTGGHISIAAEPIGDKIKISIHDTGVGISSTEQEKLFSRYNRVEEGYSRTQVGTGIGLSLAKHLVELNGGVIGVESEPGKGSTFWILVPVPNQCAIQPEYLNHNEQQEEQDLARIDGLNILVVDDNVAVCELLRTIIEAAGGTPFIAHSVEQAKELIKASPLDTAIIDLAMPGENGLSLIHYLRNECTTQSHTMPLLVVSACVFDSDRNLALNQGASTFIAKPFRPVELLKNIRELTIAATINTH